MLVCLCVYECVDKIRCFLGEDVAAAASVFSLTHEAVLKGITHYQEMSTGI